MGVFNPSVLTKKGASLSAKAVAGITELQFTKIAIGDSVLTGDLSSLTDIGVIKQIADVSGISIEADSVIRTNAVFSNKDLSTGYYLRAIGLYAEDPDEGEILYCISIADESTTTADWMPPFTQIGLTALTVGMVITVSDTSTVSMTISDTAYASAEEVAKLRKDVDEMAEKVENTVGGFTSLEKIGVNDAELSPTEWTANINTITRNCSYDSNWVLRYSEMASNSNLLQSAIAYINNKLDTAMYPNQKCSLRIEWITHGDYAHMLIDFFWGYDRYQCNCVALKSGGYQLSDFDIISKKVNKLDHNINSYNTLEQLGISDEDDFYADKWSTNVRRLDSWSPTYTNWVLTYGGIASSSKLLTSALATINSIFTAEAENRTADSYVSLKVERHCYTDYTHMLIEFRVGGKVYNCVYEDLDGTYSVQPFVEAFYNKPSGSYVGTGKSGTVINTGSTGNAILIWTENTMTLVTSYIAMHYKSSSGDTGSCTNATFTNGVLSVRSADTHVNKSDTTYYYQVL